MTIPNIIIAIWIVGILASFAYGLLAFPMGYGLLVGMMFSSMISCVCLGSLILSKFYLDEDGMWVLILERTGVIKIRKW